MNIKITKTFTSSNNIEKCYVHGPIFSFTKSAATERSVYQL